MKKVEEVKTTIGLNTIKQYYEGASPDENDLKEVAEMVVEMVQLEDQEQFIETVLSELC